MVRCIGAILLGSALAEPDYVGLWNQFKVDFDKNFNGLDELERFAVFKSNIDFIEEENAKHLSYKLGITKFADWTLDEFQTMARGVPSGERPKSDLAPHRWTGQELPTSINWTAKGAVTPVKDQGSCGSCWAFSTTGVLEGANFLASGDLTSLAEDQILHCANQISMGCSGGFPNDGLKYASNHAVCAAEGYWPYLRSPGCVDNNCSKVGVNYREVLGFVDVPRDSEEDLLSAVAQQPVSVCIEADQSAFQHYKSGIVTSGCGSQLDHAVLAVGYGTEDGQDYWLIKNSWGSSWGDAGYIKLGRGGSETKGVCGVLDNAVYPVFQKFPVADDVPVQAAPNFAPGVGLLYQGIDRSLGQNGQVGIYSVDLASQPCCSAQLIQRITGDKPSRHDDRYEFANSVTMMPVSSTQSFALVSNEDGNAVFLEAARSEDGLTATVSVASDVAMKEPPKGLVAVDAAGEKVALYFKYKGSLMFKSFDICIGSVSDKGSFKDKSCEKVDKAYKSSIHLNDGHLSTGFWDAARQRMVLIANNCRDGLCWDDSGDHWFPWTNDPGHVYQSIFFATADLANPQLTQQKLEVLPADVNRTWYPRKCDVVPSGNYLCLVWSGQKSGFVTLDGETLSWSSDVQVSDQPLHDFALVDGRGLATDVANGLWTFDDFAQPKLERIGTLEGPGLETRAPVGRLWAFASRSSVMTV